MLHHGYQKLGRHTERQGRRSLRALLPVSSFMSLHVCPVPLSLIGLIPVLNIARDSDFPSCLQPTIRTPLIRCTLQARENHTRPRSLSLLDSLIRTHLPGCPPISVDPTTSPTKRLYTSSRLRASKTANLHAPIVSYTLSLPRPFPVGAHDLGATLQFNF